MTREPIQQGRALGVGGPCRCQASMRPCVLWPEHRESRSCGISGFCCCCCCCSSTEFAIRHPALMLTYHSKQTSNVSFHPVIFQKPNKLSQERSELVTCPWVSRYISGVFSNPGSCTQVSHLFLRSCRIVALSLL